MCTHTLVQGGNVENRDRIWSDWTYIHTTICRSHVMSCTRSVGSYMYKSSVILQY